MHFVLISIDDIDIEAREKIIKIAKKKKKINLRQSHKSPRHDPSKAKKQKKKSRKRKRESKREEDEESEEEIEKKQEPPTKRRKGIFVS